MRKYVGAGVTWAFGLVLVAPLVLVVVAAFVPLEAFGVSSEQWAAHRGAFGYVLDTYGRHLQTSFVVALAAGALAIVLGAPAGFAVARDGRATRTVAALLTWPLAIPGLATAIALLTAYPGRGGALGLLIIGHTLYTLPYCVRTIAEATRAARLDVVIDAARTLGAGRCARLRYIVWPSLRGAVSAALLVALAVSWGEFNVSFLLATPSSSTFPAALYLTYTTNSFPIAAAATTLLFAGLVPLIVLSRAVGGTPEQRV